MAKSEAHMVREWHKMNASDRKKEEWRYLNGQLNGTRCDGKTIKS